jgi:hypothetical protein
MSEKYTIYIESTAEDTRRQIVVEDVTPMEAHKTAYMEVSKYEEITMIRDSEGIVVFDAEGGFVSLY